MSNRRGSLDLSQEQVLDCFALLPVTARSKTAFVPYSDINFKHSPKWDEAKQYVPCLARVLQFSGGLGVNQVSMVAGSKEWAAKLDISTEALEAGVYRLRAMLSQLSNMKSKNRAPPNKMAKLFEPLLAMIAHEPAKKEIAEPANLPLHDDDLQIVPVVPEPVPVLVIDDDDDDDDDNDDRAGGDELSKGLSDLFESEDPELKRLLQPVKRRVSVKSSAPAFGSSKPSDGRNSLAEIEAFLDKALQDQPAKDPITPARWRNLSVKLKKKEVKPKQLKRKKKTNSTTKNKES